MRVAVGVDAGGSRTVVAVARGAEAPRIHAAGGANPNFCGSDAAVETIAAAISEALGGEVPRAIVVGGAGAARPEIAEAMARGLRARFNEARVVVTHDLQIALRAAIPNGDAMALVAGTGSAVYAEIGAQTYRAGGGGYAFGDEGSGFAIGSAGLRLLRRVLEGRLPADGFTDRLAAHTRAQTADDLSRFAYGGESTVAAVASAAAIAIECADAGERSAMKIIQTAALELFELVRALCRSAGIGGRTLPLAFCGGLLQHNSLLTYLIETRIANELPNLEIVKGAAAPHLGALERARALLNGSAA